ncbi:MAG: YeeE/YedE family protein, partial [bacterium]|nr:YeeE/YedE family protein [bacterium]
MRTLIYLFIGILFGITMFKSEAASWFRIYEMFKFESFHMYGIIGSALAIGIIVVQFIKRFKIKSFYGEKINFNPKEKSF